MENRSCRAAFSPNVRLVLYSIVLFACFFACVCAQAAGNWSAWANSTELTLNTSPSGAGIGESVTGFPLLVRLTAENFDFPQAQPDGRDIRFSKPDGTPLPYEIERWDAAGQAAEIWVKVDTIRGGDAAQSLRMYWGNPAAPDGQRDEAIFGAGNGFEAVWHLGGGTGARANAAGGNPALPSRYDGDESVTGVIAGADSLDGLAAGDYLDLGGGYAAMAGGMTFTVWAYPTAIRQWSHLLDLGNGADTDNIVLGRWDTTSGLEYVNWSGAAHSAINAPGQIDPLRWQLLGVAVSGKTVRLYKDGALVASDTSAIPIRDVARSLCFLGRSNSPRGQYFQGKLDEAEISRTARSPAWMKLAYQNQKPAQAIPALRKSSPCAFRFEASGDSLAPEGGLIALKGRADCGSGISWTQLSGPTSRILDPGQTELELIIPRVAGDTAAVFRFTAVFADSTRTRDVRVAIREAIPEPAFAMPADSVWDGRTPLAYRPSIANLPAIRASRDTALNWSWSFAGTPVATEGLPDGVLLREAEPGDLSIRLCLDNGGPRVCRNAKVKISQLASAGLSAPGNPVPLAKPRRGKDALGRSVPIRPGIGSFRVIP
jgi:hypothetical protein